MHFIKTAFLAVIGFSAMSLAMPLENASTATADECNDAFRGTHRACEHGLRQEAKGERQELRGERQIANGNILGGLANIAKGGLNQLGGKAKECTNSRYC